MNDKLIENQDEDIDFFDQEIERANKLFSKEKLIRIQNIHDVQIVRGEDYQYHCHIKGKVWSTGLTFFGALVFGIENFDANN